MMSSNYYIFESEGFLMLKATCIVGSARANGSCGYLVDAMTAYYGSDLSVESENHWHLA